MSLLRLPLAPYTLSPDVWRFGDRVPRRFGLWGVHLGDDIVAAAGTSIQAIGNGTVVLARTLPGSEAKRSWGGVIVLQHRDFISVYGHLQELQVNEGDIVNSGQQVGSVAAALTPENGWWKQPHLHFAIYTGPLPARRTGGAGPVLPGYWRPERFWQTRLAWWREPKKFIEEYNRSQVG